uniref:Slit homolog 1 protein-like n=1 Tax=Gouania willdenowi TaxID=441366 RepID=A0A8C5ECD1_GOUWI
PANQEQAEGNVCLLLQLHSYLQQNSFFPDKMFRLVFALTSPLLSAVQCLSSLQFLERLDLSYNLLRGLPWDFSHSLSSLQELRLDHNLLQHVASLGELDSLRKLDLSYNHIQSMDVGALVGLSSLSVLSLEGNRLEVLREGLLSRQQRLEVLKLGHNNVSLIEAEALTPLRKLTLLSLRGNQLTHVKFKTLLKLQTTSTHLHMSSNPWFCDCELQRVFGKIRRVRHLHVDDYEDVVCHAPAQQTGHTLASLDTRLYTHTRGIWNPLTEFQVELAPRRGDICSARTHTDLPCFLVR